MRDAYYWTCPYCGSNLDPGESCDCRKEPSIDNDDDYKSVDKGVNKENDIRVQK